MTLSKEFVSVWVKPSVSCFTLLDLTLTPGVESWQPIPHFATLLTVN
jgi:hypothetical protein